MKMKFEHGDTKIKILYDGTFKNLQQSFNPLEFMYNESDFKKYGADIFSKSYFELLNKLYEKANANMLNYYKDINEIFEQFAKGPKSKSVNMTYGPDTMPATGHDIFNYASRYGLANFQIGAILKLDGFLDFDKLSNAVRLSIDSQPVFGCRFIEHEPPYWRRLDNIDETIFCTYEDSTNLDESIQNFTESPLDIESDPMIKVRLIRSEDYDTIGIKLNHACCDGAGEKEYIKLLSEIYSCIDEDYGIYIPKPSKRSRNDQDRLFKSLRISNPEAEWINGSEITKATWSFPWEKDQSGNGHIVLCRFTKEQLDDIIRFSKAKSTTINDLILTAYYRSMSEIGQSGFSNPMDISVTIDLRRYLPDNKTESIRNFSGSEVSRIQFSPNETFSETLSKVVASMNIIKNKRPGLQSAIGLERIESITFKEARAYYDAISQWSNYCPGKCAPILSNLGLISNTLLKFGEKAVTDAYIIPPIVKTPGLMLMVCTYNGILTLATGYYEGSVSREVIEKLLNRIKDELIEGCKI